MPMVKMTITDDDQIKSGSIFNCSSLDLYYRIPDSRGVNGCMVVRTCPSCHSASLSSHTDVCRTCGRHMQSSSSSGQVLAYLNSVRVAIVQAKMQLATAPTEYAIAA